MTTLAINKDLNGIEVTFESKPAQEVIEILKNNGFRWSPKNKAWQRQLTDNARYAYQNIKSSLKDALMA